MDTDLKDWTNMKIALLGYGTVGRGVDKIIGERVDDVEVSRILELPDRLSDPRMTSEYEDIVSDPEIGMSWSAWAASSRPTPSSCAPSRPESTW